MGAYFQQQPASRPLGASDKKRRMKRLVEPWACSWQYKGKDRLLKVPAGYKWDGMSVPRWAVSLSGLYPGGMSDAPSLGHDALYRAQGGQKPDSWEGCILTGDKAPITRKEADWVLKALMKRAGFWGYRCWVAYQAVRIGGRKHWGGPTPKTR